MSLPIEKEEEWLSSIILPKLLTDGKLVDNYNEDKADTFQVESIDINVIGAAEAFMLTQCYRATIKFVYAGERITTKLVIKKTPEVPEQVYKSIQFPELFSNEIDFYTVILPKIQSLAGGKFAAPKYYYSDQQVASATVILGDFATDGWRVPKERVGLSLEHARIAMQYLGRFHGFSYALKYKEPAKFAELTERLRESRYARDDMHPDWALILKTSLKRMQNSIAKYQPDVDEEFAKKFINLTEDYLHYGRQRVAPQEPIATLCHGDYLRNNVAFRYDENDQPLDIMMFDYQTLRYSSPMIDLTTFLAISVYAEVRHKHFDTLFDDYCQNLFESYRRHAIVELPKSINRENLLKEYIRFLPYSVSISSSFLLALVEPQNVSAAEMMNNQMSPEELIKDTMQRGGEIVNREVAHQVKEMFDLSRKYNVDIAEGIKPKE
ncbi:uncharacterized protein Dwil_GK20724 [Drosophila willistoni]|uniref:CHK kinase-like domain-containing protein n=1 Tax=Drosophila willistoni TaxID=7260 RepID=B4MJY1_DROWI|nr:uncharacterized protein LOC6638274 [Drosophila willistoni]EDW72420.1 uncharacterized protein Dwil_GK20724 [Drosophila willistoni]